MPKNQFNIKIEHERHHLRTPLRNQIPLPDAIQGLIKKAREKPNDTRTHLEKCQDAYEATRRNLPTPPGHAEFIRIEDLEGCWGRVDTILIDASLDSVWFVEKTFTAGATPVIKRARAQVRDPQHWDTLTVDLDYVENEYIDRTVDLQKIEDTLWVNKTKYRKEACR